MENLYAEIGRYDANRLNDADFELNECTACGLVFQHFVPDERLMTEIYGSWHDDQKTRVHWTAKVDVARRLEIAREVGVAWSLARRDQHNLRLLDYGAGMGIWAGMAKATGAEVWGLEFSPARRAQCEAQGIRMCDESELPADYFDYIQLDQVLEHVAEPRVLLQKLQRWLRPGGIVCVAVPQGRGTKRALRRWRHELKQPNLGRLVSVVPLLHLNCFNHANLQSIAEAEGLASLRPPWRALQSMWALPPGWRSKLRALARPFYLRSRLTTRMYFQRPGHESSNHHADES